MPTCWIIAGPNGAGKTTFSLKYLPKIGCANFINADLIAAGLSPLEPERELIAASKILLQEIKHHIAIRNNFAVETTLAGRSYLRLIKELKADGWNVELIYLALPNVRMSKKRVAERVEHGGHNIPIKNIERRFSRSISNLMNEFSGLVDNCLCFMNNSENPVLIFEDASKNRRVIHKEYYQLLIGEIQK